MSCTFFIQAVNGAGLSTSSSSSGVLVDSSPPHIEAVIEQGAGSLDIDYQVCGYEVISCIIALTMYYSYSCKLFPSLKAPYFDS